jgi:flagellum-specific peptidoglycan hydrolase FlgJ
MFATLCHPDCAGYSEVSHVQVQTVICEPTERVLAESKRLDPQYDHVYAFVDEYLPDAIWVQQQFGTPVSVTLVQGGWESGWGQHTCGGNNFYGVKGYYDGAGNVCASGEHENGEDVIRDSVFKVYPDGRASFYDHTWLLNQSRYKGVRTAATYQEACRALQEAGYATSDTYAVDLVNTIEDFDLDQYDLPRYTSRGGVYQEAEDPVVTLQTALSDRGYSLGPCGVDGLFGPATRRAVKAFQADARIIADGVVGLETWALLMGV